MTLKTNPTSLTIGKEAMNMPSLVRWDPFREMAVLQDRVNRLFEDFFGREEKGGLVATGWSPLADLREEPDEFVATVELPGVPRENIQVEVMNNLLTVCGERKFEHEDRRDRYHRIERAYGRFHRSWQLPSTVDSDKVTAEYQDGVLTVHLPKSEAARPKQIEVKAS
jgi:HSP20 family protein